MSGKSPAVRGGNGVGKGPARGYSWPPFEQGNGVARRHAFYAEKFQPSERAEVGELAELLRSVLPLYSPSFEPHLQALAGRLWRVRRAYKFIEEHAEEEIPRSLLVNLGTLENTVSRDFEALGLSARAAAGLGIDLQRLARAAGEEDSFNWNLLSREERAELSRLLEKMRAEADA
jgi:hypothetical protein